MPRQHKELCPRIPEFAHEEAERKLLANAPMPNTEELTLSTACFDYSIGDMGMKLPVHSGFHAALFYNIYNFACILFYIIWS
jgi:hypothetical protein